MRDKGRRRVIHPYATRTSRDHRVAARIGKRGREAPPPRHVGLTRRARLRRAGLAVVLVAAVGVGGWAAATRWMGSAGETSSAEPNQQGATADPVVGASGTEGSSGTETGQAGTSVTSSSPPVPEKGDGTFKVVGVPGRDSSRSGRRVSYTVEVENGLKGVSSAGFAKEVRKVLRGDQGWEPVDKVHFVNVSPARERRGADVDIRITLASPATTDELCSPLPTNGELSCWNGERSVINVRRWLLGADSYAHDLKDFRIYVINHEVGHGLGHHHVDCPGEGQRAPVMLQQTLGLQGCTRWPYPKGS